MQEREADQPNQEPVPPSRGRDASGPAIAATVALIVFSVFIGVFGPRLGNRQQVPAGTTLGELSENLATAHARRVAEALGSRSVFARGPAPLEASDARDSLEAIVRSAVALPAFESTDPRALVVEWLRVDPIRAPGARGAQLFGRTTSGEFASVFVLRDEDRYTVFDRFGRPAPMPLGEEFRMAIDASGRDEMVVFRERDLVFAVASGGEEVANELAAGFRLAEARREAVAPSSPDT